MFCKNISVISSYETSQRLPTLIMLKKIVTEFGVSTDYLLGMKQNASIDVSELTTEQINALLMIVNEVKRIIKESITLMPLTHFMIYILLYY